MNLGKSSFKSENVTLLSCVSLLMTMTGCIGYVDRPRDHNAYVAPPAVETVVVVPDDYVYYPDYEIYYSNRRRQYAYRDGGAWVSRPEPRGVSVNVLIASPSVRMEFHDSPARHHAAIVRQYPRNGVPPGPYHQGKESRKDDRLRERGER